MLTNPVRKMRIVPYPARLRVCWHGLIIVDTIDALMLHEGSSAAVPYIPRGDVDMTLLEKSTATSRCPYKGDAVYFSLRSDFATALDVAWSYEKPFPEVRPIAGHLAFNANDVEFIENNSL